MNYGASGSPSFVVAGSTAYMITQTLNGQAPGSNASSSSSVNILPTTVESGGGYRVNWTQLK